MMKNDMNNNNTEAESIEWRKAFHWTSICCENAIALMLAVVKQGWAHDSQRFISVTQIAVDKSLALLNLKSFRNGSDSVDFVVGDIVSGLLRVLVEFLQSSSPDLGPKALPEQSESKWINTLLLVEDSPPSPLAHLYACAALRILLPLSGPPVLIQKNERKDGSLTHQQSQSSAARVVSALLYKLSIALSSATALPSYVHSKQSTSTTPTPSEAAAAIDNLFAKMKQQLSNNDPKGKEAQSSMKISTSVHMAAQVASELVSLLRCLLLSSKWEFEVRAALKANIRKGINALEKERKSSSIDKLRQSRQGSSNTSEVATSEFAEQQQPRKMWKNFSGVLSLTLQEEANQKAFDELTNSQRESNEATTFSSLSLCLASLAVLGGFTEAVRPLGLCEIVPEHLPRTSTDSPHESILRDNLFPNLSLQPRWSASSNENDVAEERYFNSTFPAVHPRSSSVPDGVRSKPSSSTASLSLPPALTYSAFKHRALDAGIMSESSGNIPLSEGGEEQAYSSMPIFTSSSTSSTSSTSSNSASLSRLCIISPSYSHSQHTVCVRLLGREVEGMGLIGLAVVDDSSSTSSSSSIWRVPAEALRAVGRIAYEPSTLASDPELWSLVARAAEVFALSPQLSYPRLVRQAIKIDADLASDPASLGVNSVGGIEGILNTIQRPRNGFGGNSRTSLSNDDVTGGNASFNMDLSSNVALSQGSFRDDSPHSIATSLKKDANGVAGRAVVNLPMSGQELPSSSSSSSTRTLSSSSLSGLSAMDNLLRSANNLESIRSATAALSTVISRGGGGGGGDLSSQMSEITRLTERLNDASHLNRLLALSGLLGPSQMMSTLAGNSGGGGESGGGPPDWMSSSLDTNPSPGLNMPTLSELMRMGYPGATSAFSANPSVKDTTSSSTSTSMSSASASFWEWEFKLNMDKE
jgi:hypothetical protein